MIAIVDYGMGNPGSIRNMLGRMGHRAAMARTPAEAEAAGATGIILPGVGAFDEGMTRLRDLGWEPFLRQEVGEGRRTLLGICLGMQLLFERSEEGRLPGLGLLEGAVIRFAFAPDLTPVPRIPNMGWRHIAPVNGGSELLAGLDGGARFYFVHSYHCTCARAEDRVAEAVHGFAFTCAVRRGRVHGVQFHPEKSHRFGMRVLDNYARLAVA